MTTAVNATPGTKVGPPMIQILPDPPESDASPSYVLVPRVEVGPGEMALLTGPSGCGKSTIVRAAAGLASWPGGRVTIAGTDLGAMSHRKRRQVVTQLRLFFLPQEPPLISNLTVLENLLLPIRYLGERDERDAMREALILLEAAGLGHAGAMLPAGLTIEDRKTVVLLRGFLRRPAVALLDEPLFDLNEESLAAVRSLMVASMREGGCAILAAAFEPDPYTSLGAQVFTVEPGCELPGAGSGGSQ